MASITLTRGAVALIDDEDLPLVAGSRWSLARRVTTDYAVSKQGYMHRVILGAKRGQEVDHINGDGLDNRRGNLRLVTHQQNQCNRIGLDGKNTSGFRGVYFRPERGYWAAKICARGKSHYLGSFSTAESAAMAYDEAAVRIHGEFARLNSQVASPPHKAEAMRRVAMVRVVE